MILGLFTIYLICALLIFLQKRRTSFFLTLANIFLCLLVFLYHTTNLFKMSL